MFTQAPEIIIDATIGQIIVQPTATATATSTAVATDSPSTGSDTSATTSPIPTATASPRSVILTPAPKYTFPPIPTKKSYFSRALSIYGYGPSNSEITLKGFGVSERTTIDGDGFFRFESVYSLTYLYPELCIQSSDFKARVTQPTCIAPLLANVLIPAEVGPILLSPTISIQDGHLIGKSVPNSNLKLHIFKKDKYKLPVLDVVTNEIGEFEINLPSGNTADYKIFVAVDFDGYPSAKSNTLKYSASSSTKSFWQTIIQNLIQNKIIAFIIAEVLVFVILFLSALKLTTKGQKRHSEREYLEELKNNQ